MASPKVYVRAAPSSRAVDTNSAAKTQSETIPTAATDSSFSRLPLFSSSTAAACCCNAAAISASEALPTAAIASRLVHPPTASPRATNPGQIWAVTSATTSASSANYVANPAVTAVLASTVCSSGSAAPTPKSDHDGMPAGRQHNAQATEHTAATATAATAVAGSPTPSATSHDEVVHPDPAAPAAVQALGPEALKAGRADQSRRAAHQ